jgi:AcrR family transcriptional regulator
VSSREQAILRAAERLFFDRSFDGVSVDDIGRHAGVSGSAIYRHFSGKDEILAGLFDEVMEAILARLGEPDEDPRADVERLLRVYVDLAVQHDKLAAIWLRDQRSLSEKYRRDHDHRQRRINDRMAGALQRCFPERAPDEVVTAVRGLQVLLLSESLRPPSGRRAPDAGGLLYAMALGCLAVLAQPRNANSWRSSSSSPTDHDVNHRV